MRKSFTMLAALLLCISFALIEKNALAPTRAEESSKDYALITASNAIFYRNTSDEEAFSSYFFELPKDYYVELLSKTPQNGYLRASFDGISGFAKAVDLEIVAYEPNSIFPKGQTILIDDGVFLVARSKPDNVSENLGMLESTGTSQKFFGEIEGANVKGTTKWFCIPFEGDIAYLSGHYTSIDSPIAQNTIGPKVVEKPVDEKAEGSVPLEIFLAVVITIPVLLIIFFLFKGGSKNEQQTRQTKQKVTRYYDDGDYYRIPKYYDDES